MNVRYEFPQSGEKIVYVRRVEVSELPDEVRAQLGNAEAIYAVHSEDGERLALVRDRRTAFFLARQNNLAPVSVN